MKFFILLITVFCLVACAKHESKETIEPYDQVNEVDASYRTQLSAKTIEQLFPDRCDRLTFLAAASAFVGDLWNVRDYEKSDGEWWRDIQSCLLDLDGNGEPDSKSQISFDAILFVLHFGWTEQDFDLLVRLKDYGAQNSQKYGKGPNDLTVLPQVAILLADMLDSRNLVEKSLELDGTHNEHLLAASFWLKLRIEGYLTDVEKIGLENIKQTKLKEALLNRITDGNQEKIIEYLSSFPDELPLETGWESWGGMPAWLYWFLLKAVIDGR